MTRRKDDETGEPFWTLPLERLTRPQWERLCDGCGRCCLVKLEDEDTGAIHHTNVGCDLLDPDTGRCRDYAKRKSKVPDCVRLSVAALKTIAWLPPTCAYRLRFEGKDLPDWHPLLTGDPDSVHRAGVSVRGKVAASEGEVETDDLPHFIVLWPKRWPRRRKGPAT
ncbi:MAG TPA: YcgN family cysteine cluster protein [Methylosinus sp.]|jgi:uncharacterized cysteine cluster protein YcgN (CxxCxxCC family)